MLVLVVAETLVIAFFAAPIVELLAARSISDPAAEIQLCDGGEEDILVH
jgi:hypothetical protein